LLTKPCPDWPSPDAIKTAFASPDFPRIYEEVSSLRGSSEVTHSVLGPSYDDMLSALNAPVTEFLTVFGVEPGFLENFQLLTAKMKAAPSKGYHGAVVGAIDEEITNDLTDGKKVKAVRFLAGWESVQARLDASHDENSSES
jgi:hypothetical protein